MSRFDRIVAGVVLGLLVLVGGLVVLGDRTGLSVAHVTPADGSQPPVTSSIIVTFSEPVDPASVEGHLSFQPDITGDLSWQDNRTLVFTPDPPLPSGQPLTITLGVGFTSTAARVMRHPYSWTFTPRSPGILFLAPADAPAAGLWALPPGESEATELYAPQLGIFDYTLSPDGTQIAMTVYDDAYTTDLWLMNADGSHLKRLTNCAPQNSCASPAWSPDGTQLAYERREGDENRSLGPSRVWTLDIATGQTAPVFEDTQVIGFSPRYDPAGNYLAFYDSGEQVISLLDLSTGSTTAIPNQMGETGAFAPDGSALAYVDIRQVGIQFYPEIWLAKLDAAGGLVPLVDDPQEDNSPAWSPDGQRIAFARRRLDRQGGLASQVMLLNLATGDLQQLTDDPDYNTTRIAWDPTGQRLLVQRFDLSQPGATTELWIYDLSNNSLTQIDGNGFDGQWLP